MQGEAMEVEVPRGLSWDGGGGDMQEEVRRRGGLKEGRSGTSLEI